MQTKTYFASSVPAALEVARKELGAEALLVNSKPAAAAARPFGKLEVTFAYEPRVVSQVPEPSPDRERRPGTELDEIRRQLSALRMAVGQAGHSVPLAHPAAAEQRFGENILLDGGLERETACMIAEAAGRRTGDRYDALAEELAARIPTSTFTELAAGESRTLAFIGPAGRGKTSSMVKVAVRYGLAQRVPVRIFGAGAHGIGGQEQLARYAAILGVPFQAWESYESVHLALNGDQWKGITLIDTPGISPLDREGLSELGSFVSRRQEVETHLVLRADSRSADMSHVVSRFKPSRLLFAGADEALEAGAMIQTLIATGIPATFVGTGQEIPDDLAEVDARGLAERLFGRKAFAAIAA